MRKENIFVKNNNQAIIAIGASSGGLEPLMTFLLHLPTDLNCSIIIAQHLANSPKSQLVQLLKKKTNLSVLEAANGCTLEPHTIYVSPSNKNIQVLNNLIVLSNPVKPLIPKPSIDILFNSLAKSEFIENVYAIVLSGTGSDGSEGIKKIKEAGGYVIVQETSSAEFSGMPQSAIDTGCTNAVITVAEMGEEIQRLEMHPEYKNIPAIINKEGDEEIGNKLFALLSFKTGTDFSRYKSSTIYRRINKRILALNLKSLSEYLQYIDAYPNELVILYKVILIGVTSFFRDIEAFDALKIELNKLIGSKKLEKTIRIWDVGCATGEESFTIGIILQELLGDEINDYSIKIFATDISDNALSIARKGIYQKEALETLPKGLLEKYFIQKEEDTYEVVKSVRKLIYFSKHDVTNNPPFIKMDVISCWNLLIYFGASLQKYTLPLFHYSLNTGGILLLGKSESIGSFVDLFAVIDSINKLFVKNSVTNRNTLKPFLFTNLNIPNNTFIDNTDKKLSVKDLIKETLLNTLEYPYVVVNENGDIQESNGDLRLFISLASGVMNTNLLKLINTDMQLEVRTLFSKVRKENKAGKTKLKRFKLYDKEHFVIVSIKPIVKEINSAKLFLVLFETLELSADISSYGISNDESVIEFKFREMELELIATKEHLNSYIEELETLNEELQSSNEELQSANEELQSTNEELQSTGEELQSSNEELNITNDALNASREQSGKANKALEKLNKELINADNLLKLKEKEINRAVFIGEEKNRKAISLELHDNICQMLVGAKMLLSSYYKNKDEKLLKDATSVINDSIKEIRNLSHVIYIPKEVDEKFIGAIQVLLKQINITGTTNFKVIDDVDDTLMTADFKVNLYRILQEQIQNVIKHSKATNGVILLITLEDKLIVSVKDDGKGCDLSKNNHGIGLANIKTRAGLYDGKISIISNKGKGFELKLEFALSNILKIHP